jgi:nitroimidazol reductase NimA-like FMN-containing flavoprotein (pyridoxamine 5'-phosphate oxidase superfamily)
MVRNNEIKDIQEIEQIISKIKVCHISMVDGEVPYVIPFNFGYKDNCIFIHTGEGGRKLDILQNKNNRVCISMESDSELYVRHEQVACSYSMNFKSVIISGKVEFIDDLETKKDALKIIMSNYTEKNDFEFGIPALKAVVVMKIAIEEISARVRGKV